MGRTKEESIKNFQAGIAKTIDLNEFLVTNQASTFLVKVDGNSMEPGIHSGDILVVDKSLEPKPNSVVIVIIDGQFMVKRLIFENGDPFLMADNSSYSTVKLANDTEIWGIVKYAIHKLS